jgi:citrate synthase
MKKQFVKLKKELCKQAIEHARISPELYQRFNVKRGLRNEDGSGVLVGLTEIGAVIGYEFIDEELVPIPGRLLYRGYDVQDIAHGARDMSRRLGYEETAYLLLFGELPNQNQLEQFHALLAANRELPKNFSRDVIMTFTPLDVMNSLARSVITLYSHDPDPDGVSPETLVRQSVELIAMFPPLIAYSYQAVMHKLHNKSLIIHPPKTKYGAAENFLYMMRADGKFSALEARILDEVLVLHAEHGGGNNSTFTTHVVSSTGSDTYSAIAAAIGSLKGPLHGGANIMVVNMIEFIKKTVKKWDDDAEIIECLEKIMKRETFDKAGKLYGFGHAVYTVSDPRAICLKETAEELAKEKGRLDELKLYLAVERLAPECFRRLKGNTKQICANVDFYSGFVYECLGIPMEVYTPLFAMSRVSGWLAHRIEEIYANPRLIRPAYKNVTRPRGHVSMKERWESSGESP